VGGVATPLLALSLSSVTLLVGTSPGATWPGLSLFLFAVATVAFVTAASARQGSGGVEPSRVVLAL
jgi:hypothetical protein